MIKLKALEELPVEEKKSFVLANKEELIREKKSVIKIADVFAAPIHHVKDPKAEKAAGSGTNPDVLRVKVVANVAMLMDSQYDVLLPDNAKKSIKERKAFIPHLADHRHTIDSKIGEVHDIYYQDIPLKELGWDGTGTAQALIFETDVYKSYNEKIFNQYKLGKIQQHSIGLSYVSLSLAVNDDGDEKEKDFWNKYIDKIINKEDALKSGFFWVVPEIKLMENSSVLWGSNFLTPTLSGKIDTQNEPPLGTQQEPSNESKSLSDVIKTIKFFT